MHRPSWLVVLGDLGQLRFYTDEELRALLLRACAVWEPFHHDETRERLETIANGVGQMEGAEAVYEQLMGYINFCSSRYSTEGGQVNTVGNDWDVVAAEWAGTAPIEPQLSEMSSVNHAGQESAEDSTPLSGGLGSLEMAITSMESEWGHPNCGRVVRAFLTRSNVSLVQLEREAVSYFILVTFVPE